MFDIEDPLQDVIAETGGIVFASYPEIPVNLYVAVRSEVEGTARETGEPIVMAIALNDGRSLTEIFVPESTAYESLKGHAGWHKRLMSDANMGLREVSATECLQALEQNDAKRCDGSEFVFKLFDKRKLNEAQSRVQVLRNKHDVPILGSWQREEAAEIPWQMKF